MGLVKQGGQYQIIVGNNVAAAYAAILKKVLLAVLWRTSQVNRKKN